MDFDLSEEQRLWQQTVRDFCEREVRPLAAAMDHKAELDAELVAKMGPLGILGLNAEPEFGGAGVDAVSAAVAIEALGWACGGTALSVAAHNGLCCSAISLFGSQAQKARWLPALASGGSGLGSLALTEPGAGSDLASGVRTRAELNGNEWVINGSKAWITNASLAPVIVTLCRTDPDPEAGSRALSLIVVNREAEGIHVHPAEKKLGVRASPTHAVSYTDVRVPADHLLGEKGQGLSQALEILDGGRIGIGALSVGLAQAAHEESIRYAHERETFGAPIASRQAIRFMIADAETQIEAARNLVYKAAWLKGAGRGITQAAAMAKLLATEMAEVVCRNAIQIFGGYGYSQEFPVERIYRDARLMTIGEGTSEIQRMVIARRVLDQV